MELDVEVLVVDDLVGGLVLGVGVDVGVYSVSVLAGWVGLQPAS